MGEGGEENSGEAAMIEIENVSKTYNGKVRAVDGLTLTVPAGEIVGFLGPNGAGKTTTLKMITGILSPDAGSIRVDGMDIARRPIDVKRIIGYVPDNPDQFLKLKGTEYLRFMADMYGVPAAERNERVRRLAETFELSGSMGETLQSFSHGMRQKIVLIGALLHDPGVFILDEPLTGLDPKSSFSLKEILRERARDGRTVFFSTHVLDVAERLCDRVAVIHKGRLLFYGTLAEMKAHAGTNATLESMFLEMTGDA
jgi:ABC-2 type transport system ATP-binding protein